MTDKILKGKKKKIKLSHGKKILEGDFKFFKNLEKYEAALEDIYSGLYREMFQFRKYMFNTYLNKSREIGFTFAWEQLNDFRNLTHRERYKKREELLGELNVK